MRLKPQALVIVSATLGAQVLPATGRRPVNQRRQGQGCDYLGRNDDQGRQSHHPETTQTTCINGPDSTVLSGPVAAIEAVAARARRRGWTATRLRVRGAFHSPAMLPAASALAPMLAACKVSTLQRPVVSTTTASVLSPVCDLRAHLLNHITAPVRFIEAMDRVAGSADLGIKVGSGNGLSHCASAWLDLPVLPLDVAGDSMVGLTRALATAYVHGADIDPTALAGNRSTATFNGLSTTSGYGAGYGQSQGAGYPVWGADHGGAGAPWRAIP